MLLAFDSNVLTNEYNIDAQFGEKIDIPTVIIPKDTSQVIREHLQIPGNEKIIMSIKFSGVREDGFIDIKLFFRSDDVKSLSFFKEFSSYKDKLLDKLTFTPVYKIYLPDEDTSNTIELPDDEKQGREPCVKNDHYCVLENNDLKISNPRYVLLENIRQSCIYNMFDLGTYWNYMETFTELCADPNNPTFNLECSMNALRSSSLYDSSDDITECMKEMTANQGKIEEDYNLFNVKRVYRTPELMINNVKYRGDWYAKYIFNTICAGFIENDAICGTPKPEEVKVEKNYGWRFIGYTVLALGVVMIVLLIGYRRYVNKSLESSLNQRIEEQARRTIGV